jgi:hypothetical protein
MKGIDELNMSCKGREPSWITPKDYGLTKW